MKRLRELRLFRALKGEDGFSLTELMVVIVIIGILTLLALPRFMNITSKAKAVEAKRMLRQVHGMMQAYYFEFDQYTTDLAAIGFEQLPTVDQGGDARYLLSVESVDGANFIAVATAVVDFDKDGTFHQLKIDATGRIVEEVPD